MNIEHVHFYRVVSVLSKEIEKKLSTDIKTIES